MLSAQTLTVVQVLAFLGTVTAVVVGALAAIAFAVAGRARAAAAIAAGAATLLALYAAALVVAGALGRGRVIAPGGAKVFCEIDCHLAYSVTGARASGVPNGTRWLVTVRTRFDETTAAPWRGDDPLWPNARRVRLVDPRGRAWAPADSAGTPLATPLRPGESYETTFAFVVPDDVAAPRLELTEAGAVTRLLVGHENSPMHRKALLAVAVPPR